MSSTKRASTGKQAATPRTPKKTSSAPTPKASRKAPTPKAASKAKRPAPKTPRKRSAAATDGRTAVVCNVGFGTQEDGGAYIERCGDAFVRYEFGDPVLVTPETAARLATIGTSELPGGQHGQPGFRAGFAVWPTVAAYEAQRRQAESQVDAQRLARAQQEAAKILKEALQPKPAARQPGTLPALTGGR